MPKKVGYITVQMGKPITLKSQKDVAQRFEKVPVVKDHKGKGKQGK